MRSGDEKTSKMNFDAILGMGKIPKIESTNRNIAQNRFFVQKSIFYVPDLLTSRSKNPRGAHFYNNTEEEDWYPGVGNRMCCASNAEGSGLRGLGPTSAGFRV
jgi:hypothetical protein